MPFKSYGDTESLRYNEAKQPFIYLSAGVDMGLFLGSLELVGEAGVPFSGVLCGRATWKEGIPHFASGGVASLRGWLEDEGIANIAKLNAVLDRYASPLWDRLGGLENPAIVRRPVALAEQRLEAGIGVGQRGVGARFEALQLHRGRHRGPPLGKCCSGGRWPALA